MRAWSSLFLLLALVLAACGSDGSTAPGDDEPGDDPGDETPRDTVAPSVVSTFPEAGGTGVSVNASLRVTFSEPVILQAGGSSAMELRTEERSAPGTADWTSATVISFSPEHPLDLAASYEFSLAASAVTDTAGNPLATEHTWSFTTGGARLPSVGGLEMLRHIQVLAHDSMRGRFTGSAEELQAAHYIRARFQEMGLEPGAPGYLQEFQVVSTRVPPGTESQNVIGVLPGRGGLADEWIVLGAHYDHIGTENGEPFNGADDNASGTAMMLELARALSDHVRDGGLGDASRRSVMFHAYGAEEVGLKGSDHFCANPTVPMSRIEGMMNLDMVGRLRSNQLWVIGPRANTSLESLMVLVNHSGFMLLGDPSLLTRSDQRCFFSAEKPVAFLHTGLHPQYHTVFDDVDLIDPQGMEDVADLALRALVKMILRPEPAGDR